MRNGAANSTEGAGSARSGRWDRWSRARPRRTAAVGRAPTPRLAAEGTQLPAHDLAVSDRTSTEPAEPRRLQPLELGAELAAAPHRLDRPPRPGKSYRKPRRAPKPRAVPVRSPAPRSPARRPRRAPQPRPASAPRQAQVHDHWDPDGEPARRVLPSERPIQFVVPTAAGHRTGHVPVDDLEDLPGVVAHPAHQRRSNCQLSGLSAASWSRLAAVVAADDVRPARAHCPPARAPAFLARHVGQPLDLLRHRRHALGESQARRARPAPRPSGSCRACPA